MLTSVFFEINDNPIDRWGYMGSVSIKSNYEGFAFLSVLKKSNGDASDDDKFGWLILCY